MIFLHPRYQLLIFVFIDEVLFHCLYDPFMSPFCRFFSTFVFQLFSLKCTRKQQSSKNHIPLTLTIVCNIFFKQKSRGIHEAFISITQTADSNYLQFLRTLIGPNHLCRTCGSWSHLFTASQSLKICPYPNQHMNPTFMSEFYLKSRSRTSV